MGQLVIVVGQAAAAVQVRRQQEMAARAVGVPVAAEVAHLAPVGPLAREVLAAPVSSL
jgi:hypothetical protein